MTPSKSLRNGLTDGVWNDIISNTNIGENKSPQLSWEPVEGAKVYAVYMFDTNTNGYLHWRSGGITETSLPEGWASDYVLYPLTDPSCNQRIIHRVKMDAAYIAYEKVDYLA